MSIKLFSFLLWNLILSHNSAFAFEDYNPPLEPSDEKLPDIFKNVGIEEHLNTPINGRLEFSDENGNEIRLGTYFEDGKPVVISLNYFSCTTLCDIQLTQFAETLKPLEPEERSQFKILTISFDPKDTMHAAQHKSHQLRQIHGHTDIEWHFLYGKEENIKDISESLGFHYAFDKESDQYVHTSALFFIAADQKIKRYLYGLKYSLRDFRFALMETAEGRIGRTVDRILLYCFHYDSNTGKYSSYSMIIMRISGILTVLLLGVWLISFWKREKRKGYLA